MYVFNSSSLTRAMSNASSKTHQAVDEFILLYVSNRFPSP